MNRSQMRSVFVLMLLGAWLLLESDIAHAQTSAPAPTALVELLDQLGDTDYQIREQATWRILRMGPAIKPTLTSRLAGEADPEVRFRLRFILDNIHPPHRAVLVIRGDSAGLLHPGDLITHVGNHRVHSQTELEQQISDGWSASVLRVHGVNGPRDAGPLAADASLVLCDYRAPRGETIVAALRLYHAGYAEQANELLHTLTSPVPPSELPPLLPAIVAYTAGDVDTAQRILAGYPDACQPQSSINLWTSPSDLDLAGPRKAPFHLEWRLWNERQSGATADPDMPIQRVLVPANRYPDALVRMASIWWTQFRTPLGQQPETNRIGGNMLAVSAWMLSELDLLSECLRLIEPRSEILRRSSQGVRKWIRVRTDAWLPLLQGDPQRALDGFYEDARIILQSPGPPANRIHIQNPRIAARIAFFLYQFPQDPRVQEMLELINRPKHPALAHYAYWMLYALREENFGLVREHLLAMQPNASAADAADLARATTLLEYVHGRLNRDKLELTLTGHESGADVLRTTAEFLAITQASVAKIPALQAPLLAVPLGAERKSWLVLARDRRLLRFDVNSGALTPVEKPSPAWLPGPLNWPWLGYEESSGRAWVYDRRRVVEVCRSDGRALALNINTSDIAGFDRYVRPIFNKLPVLSGEKGETGEFWRADLRAGREYYADPELPEIGLIRVLPNDERIVHVAIRGGPHLLIEATTGKVWTSLWIGAQLGLADPPRFLAQAAREQVSPIVFLLSDVGLIRFDVAKEKLTRLELPGDEPYPALVPECCPYQRRDPRWIYCARLPQDGGKVFRVAVADNHVESLEMINEALTREYYAIRPRSEIRARIDTMFAQAGLPPLREFIADTERRVLEYAEETQP